MSNVVRHYDLYSPKARANPQAVYERMRTESPLYSEISDYSGRRFWILTRYDDCLAVLKDPRVGKEARKNMPPQIAKTFPAPTGPGAAIERHLLSLDAPDHTRLRSLVHKAFTPRIIENLRPRIEQIANDLLDEVRGDSDMDLIAGYGFPLPITVIAELLGIPAENSNQFRDWTKHLLFAQSHEEYITAATEFIAYMSMMIEQRRVDPLDDLLSNLVMAQEKGDKLDQQELLSMIFLLLVAGHETTVNLIGNGTLALMQHPDQLRRLRDQPSLIGTAIEEMLRYNGPVETTPEYWAFEDIAIRGQIIPQGDGILPALLSANRDPAVFENPNVFDITRNPNRHIAFGNGIHFCLGAPLARLEGEIAINTLLHRLPKLHIKRGTAETLEWSNSLLIHGLKALPVQF
jgi:cytochrome P450 PksS